MTLTASTILSPRAVLISLVLLCIFGVAAMAQAPTDNGTPLGLAPGSPEGSYALSGFENVNLYNGGLNFSLPLLRIGGRGSAGYTVQVPVDSKWIVTKYEWWDENNQLFTSYSPSKEGTYLLNYGPGSVHVRYSQWKPETCYIGAQTETTYRYATTSVVFTAPDGTEHELVDQATLGQPASYPSCSLNGNFRGPVFVSKDQPGMTFISDAQIRDAPWYGSGRITGYLKMPDGTVYRVDAIDHNFWWGSYYTTIISWIRDRNGNKTIFGYTTNEYGDRLTSIKDSLNRQVTIEYGVTESPYGYCDRLTYKGFGGATRVVRVSRGNLSTALRSGSTIQTYEQLFPELDGSDEPFDLPNLTTSIWLPDSDGVTRRYRLLYNSYGELARVELPTGGAIEYDWTAGLSNGSSNGLIHPVPNVAPGYDPALSQIYRRIVARRAYDVGSVLLGSTSYSRPESQNYDNSITNLGFVSVSHLNPSSQQLSLEKHFFYGTPATSFFTWQATPQDMPTYSPFAAYRDGREYQTEFYAANGQTLLRRTAQSWDQTGVYWWSGSADTAPANSPFVKETITTLADSGQVTKTTNINPQTGQIMIDQFGNPLDVWIYDYGQGQPGALLRRMHTEFMAVNPVNGVDYTNRTSATGPHMLSLPTRMSVYDAAGVERARTTMEYDNYSTDGNHADLKDWASITGVPTSGMDPSFNTYYLTRGNSTASTRYFLTTGSSTGSIVGYIQYDITGNAVKTLDARGNATTFNFVDCFGAPDGNAQTNISPGELTAAGQKSYAFASSVTNALGHTAFMQSDFYLGKVVDTEDANGTTYSGSYNDPLDRPTQVISAANRDVSLKSQSLFSYDDINRTTTQTSDFNSFNESNPLKVKVFYDGMGRTLETRKYESASNYIASRQRYDALGRVNQVSNPYRNGEPAVWTTSVYDELSRRLSVTTPDNAVATNSYFGNSTSATEQTGKRRKSVNDAMGRLTQVYEDPNGVNWLTSYTYDVLDNLITVSQYDAVSQITQSRNFTYDSLKRLLSATNPENGVVNYVYDSQGNVLVQTDARGVSKHYSYDALNRLTRSWYNGSSSTSATVNNNPALPSGVGTSDEVNLVYDSQSLPAGAPAGFSRGYATGRLVAVTYGGGSSGDYSSLDALGRPVLKVQQTGGVNYQMTAIYNNGGAQKSLTYPSNRVVNYNYDLAGRLGDKDAANLAMTGNLGDGVTRTYSKGILYTPMNGISKEQFGTDTALYHKLHYNIRGQLYDIKLSSVNDDQNWNRGAIVNYYSFQPYGFGTSGPDNNGNLLVQQHWVPNDDAISGYSFMQQNYGYDALNRVNWIGEYQNGATGTGSQHYSYDRFGNRTISSASGVGINNKQFTVSTSTNRLGVPGGQSGAMSYDAAGNLTSDTYTGQGQRVYDAGNRITQAWANSQWQTYTYDGTGQRVKRNVNGTQTWQIYGMGGELLAEYAASGAAGSPQKEYGYRNGELLVTAESAAQIKWVVADHLGTPRMIADRTGSLAGLKRHDYLPFGEELYAGTGGRTMAQGYSGDNIRQQFTSYERDNETALDYAHARYYASTQGRFTGVDPISGTTNNPQSWNGYTYTLNNPVNLTDPTGMFVNAEFGYDPNRDSDPFLDYSRKKRLWTDDIERALEVYQQMVDQGIENLRLKHEQKKESNSAVIFDMVELLEEPSAGYQKGPLSKWPETPVATATEVENSALPNTYNLDLDHEKVDPYAVLAIRVTFHTAKGFEADPENITVSSARSGKQRYTLLEDFPAGSGRNATQRDYGQVIFRVKATRLDADPRTPDITVTVKAIKDPKFTDINNPSFKAINYAKLNLRLNKIN